MRGGRGFEGLAGSGRLKPSIVLSSSSPRLLTAGDIWPALASLIREAGVAGDIEFAVTICCTPEYPFCPGRKGDLPAEPGVGSGGGAISDKCSGEIESFSDPSVLALDREESWAFAA